MKNRAYDVFLSFSVRDREELVYPLLARLRKKGLKVWFSSEELTIGDSLEETIVSGLQNSRFGLFLLTPNSIDSPWPTNELNAMWGRDNNKCAAILPVRHKISQEEVASKHPGLVNRWSLSTERGLEFIAEEVGKRVRRHKRQSRLRLIRNIVIILAFVFSLSILGFREYDQHSFYAAYSSSVDQNVRTILGKRIDRYLSTEETNYRARIKHGSARAIVADSAILLSDSFGQLKARYRNTYEFVTPTQYYQHKKYVEPAAKLDFDTLSPLNDFGFKKPLINLADNRDLKNRFRHTIHYCNTQPITYQILKQEVRRDTIIVSVKYQNYLRYIAVHLDYGRSTAYYKKTHYQIIGMLPFENIRMVKISGKWAILKD